MKPIAIVVSLAILFLLVHAGATLAQPAEKTQQLADLPAKIHEGDFRAGAESRYQSEMMARYAKQVAAWNRWSIGISAVGFILSVILGNRKHPVLSAIFLVLGFCGFVASLKSGDTAASDRYIDHAVLQRRWEALQAEWEKLEVEQETVPRERIVSSVVTLLSQQASIRSAEPPDVDDDLWDTAWIIEAQNRKLPIPPKPDPTKQASR